MEAFEVRDHAGTPEVQTFLSGFNGCRFSRFWNESLSDGTLCIVSEQSAGAMTSDYQPSASTRAAIDQLRRRLERGLYGHLDVTERCADDRSVLDHCRSGHIVLVGGSVTNPLTARRFNRYRSLRHVVDYERMLPRRTYVLDRMTGRQTHSIVSASGARKREVTRDVAVLTVMPNPEADATARARGAMLVGLMASHGMGLAGVCRTVTEDQFLEQIVDAVPRQYRATGFQVLVDVRADAVGIKWTSLHGMRLGA